MGRGQDNLLGFISKKPRKREEIIKERKTSSASNILFAPVLKPDNNLYRAKPTAAAMHRATRIAEDMKEGNYLPFLMVLDDDDIDIDKYPAFDNMFTALAGEEMTKLMRARKIPRRGKEAKKEREFLEKNSAKFLAIRVKKALSAAEDMPVAEKVEMLKNIAFIDDDFIAEVSLTSDVGGPAKDYYLNSLRQKSLGDVPRSSLQLLLNSKSDEASDILEEIIRREASNFFHTLQDRYGPTPALDYGCLRISYRGASVLHIKGPALGTLCGSRESMYPGGGVRYGSWADAPYGQDFKRCPKCIKAADEETLERLEGERSDSLEPWLDDAGQKSFEELAGDRKIKAIIRKAVGEGKSQDEIRTEVRKYLSVRVADIFVEGADKYQSGDSYIAHSGGGHVLWQDVNYAEIVKLENLGYTASSRRYGSVNFRKGTPLANILQDDVLMKATSAEERRKILRYKARSFLEANPIKRDQYADQARDILGRALRRFIRQEKKRNGTRK